MSMRGRTRRCKSEALLDEDDVADDGDERPVFEGGASRCELPGETRATSALGSWRWSESLVGPLGLMGASRRLEAVLCAAGVPRASRSAVGGPTTMECSDEERAESYCCGVWVLVDALRPSPGGVWKASRSSSAGRPMSLTEKSSARDPSMLEAVRARRRACPPCSDRAGEVGSGRAVDDRGKLDDSASLTAVST